MTILNCCKIRIAAQPHAFVVCSAVSLLYVPTVSHYLYLAN